MRSWLLFSLLAVSLFLFGCLGPAPAPPSEPVITPPAPINNTLVAPPPAPCSSATSLEANDICFKALARSESNLSWCSRIFSIDARDDCLSPFVPSDPSLCNQMLNKEKQQSCYGLVARQLNSSAYCARLTDNSSRKQCLIDVAQPCDLETNDDAKGRCLAAQHSDFTYCGSDGCLFDYAINHSDERACNLISGERAQLLACRAAVKNDPASCTADNISSRADYCYLLAAQALNNSGWCPLGQLGSPYRDNCYLHFAIQAADPSGCQKPSTEKARDQCYFDYSVALDNVSVCEKIINTLNRDSCIVHTAKANGNPSDCNPLGHSFRISCYNNVITGTVPLRDAASCAAIAAAEADIWQPRCFTALAIQRRDISICDLIAADGDKAACRAKLS